MIEPMEEQIQSKIEHIIAESRQLDGGTFTEKLNIHSWKEMAMKIRTPLH